VSVAPLVPLVVQMLARLLVLKTTGWPEAPPVALSVAAAAPNTAGEAGAKPLMTCGAPLMMTLAMTVAASA